VVGVNIEEEEWVGEVVGVVVVDVVAANNLLLFLYRN
jgi:hypothetical protein